MEQITPAQAAAAASAAQASLPAALREILEFGAVRVSARAVGTYMRDARGEPARRHKDDEGPLRIVTGTHARAVNYRPGAPNSAGGVQRLTVAGGVATYEQGVDTDVDPGGYNELRADRRRYRTLEPALADEQAAIERHADDVLLQLLREALG